MMAGDLDAARPHAQAAAMLDAGRVEESPDDARARLDYSFDLSTLGDLELGEGRFDAAREHFEEALAIREELREQDPADVFAADRVAYMLVRVAESLVLAERPREALDPLTRALDVVEELGLDRSGAAVTHRRAHLLRGEIESALDGDPCPWLAVAGDDILDQDSPISSWRLPALAARREAALSSLDACGLTR
jgi:tetratricopeptide (TPR) repeat protein